MVRPGIPIPILILNDYRYREQLCRRTWEQMEKGPASRPAADPPKPQRRTLSAALDHARLHHEAGRLAEAEAICQQILRQVPAEAEALHRLGLIAHQRRDHALAVELIGRALAARPAYPEALNNLGLIQQALGDIEAAVASHGRAVALKPDYALGHYNLGNALGRLGEWSGASESYRRAIALEPGFADAYANLGGALSQVEEWEGALSAFREALRLKPDAVPALVNLANLLRRRGRLDEALAAAERAAALDPQAGSVQHALGLALAAAGRPAEAAEALRRAVALDPGDWQALVDLGQALRRAGAFEESASRFRQAIASKPDLAAGHNGLAMVRVLQGRIEEAIESYNQAIELNPADTGYLSNLLLCLQYRAGVDRAELASAHAGWERRHGRRLRVQARPPANDRDPERRLRVGLLSGDFVRHPVGYFVTPLLAARDRAAVEIVCYSNRNEADDLTRQIEGLADRWILSHDADHRRLAEMIREDRIDILIDLSGHTGHNRLPVFARKPAPVQMTWAGYVGTTGLAAIDYLIADRFHCPPEEPYPGPERVIRLPDGYVCYAPPAYSPPVAPLPSRARGYLTFASFSNLAKLNQQTLGAWARVLSQVPGSRLLIQTFALKDAATRDAFAGRCAAAGIAADRLELRGPTPHDELLRAYHEVDIALDPFPYSGGLTTCETLWMGVPVVTFPGATFAGRHSTSHLNNVGLAELVASDLGDCIGRVVALAGDGARLEGLRQGLRARMAASPLCNAPRFARAFERALREAWRDWCQAPAERLDMGLPAPPVRPPPPAPAARTHGAAKAAPELRVAVVTPYCRESLEVLRHCHESLLAQTYPATHFMIADGHPRPEVSGWEVQHAILPSAHGNGGNTPRGVGSICAMHQEYDAITYLDADNWYTPDHIATMVALHRETRAAVCIAMRTLHRPDGSLLALDTIDSDGYRHVDTSCFFVTRPAFRVLSLWSAMPRRLWPLCDVIFWEAIKAQGYPLARAEHPTVAYRTTYGLHYKMQDEPSPPDTKSAVVARAKRWFAGLPEAERRDLQRYLKTGTW